jgi:hypothetical protein
MKPISVFTTFDDEMKRGTGMKNGQWSRLRLTALLKRILIGIASHISKTSAHALPALSINEHLAHLAHRL